MNEVRYIVHHEYPDGHEMGIDTYGPATEAELRQMLATEFVSYDKDWMDELFEVGTVDLGMGDHFRLETIKDWVVVVQWDEPESGVAVYGPYESEDQAKDDWPNIEPDFTQEWEGVTVLPEDVIFSFQRMTPPYPVKP